MDFFKLNDICEIIMGQSPPSSSYNDSGEGLPFYQGKTDFGVYFPTPRMYCNDPKRIAEPNDIIMSVRAPVGDVNIVQEDSCIGRGVAALRVSDKIEYKYLFYVLESMKVEISNKGTGSTFKAINKSALSDIYIPVFSRERQQEIVSIIEQARELMEKRQQQIEALTSLKQSIFLDLFGDPVTNIKNWELAKLSNLGQWKSGGTPSRKNKEYFKGNIPWLSSGELNNIYVSSSDEYITELAIEESSAKIITKGSLLLGMYDTAGLKSSINQIECSCNQAIAFSRIKDDIATTEFVYYVIQIMREYLLNQQRGVRQKNFNLSMIKKIKVILPPLKLQIHFTEKMREIHLMEDKLKDSLELYNNLFEGILHKAFNGELFKEEVKM